MVAIIDYGVGNLFSLKSSFGAISEKAVVTADREEIHRADQLLLPGVGAFRDAIGKLRASGLLDCVKEEAVSGKPLLGICLGMQLLFERSMEFGCHEGLSLIPGEVRGIESCISASLDIPHMGWNELHFHRESPLFQGLREGVPVYFVHSYAAFDCEDFVSASVEYSVPLTAAVQRGNVFGTQFHPEKSGETGLRILKNFCGLSREAVYGEEERKQ